MRIVQALYVLVPVLLVSCIPQPRIEPTPTPSLSRGEFALNHDYDEPATITKTLTIRCGRGSLMVEGSQRTTLTVESRVKAWATTLEEAERIAREIDVQLLSRNTENPELVITDPHLSTSDQGHEVNLRVYVPSHVRVMIDDGAGPIEVTGLSHGVEITNGGGPVTVSSVHGGVTIINNGGDVTITEARGKISVNDNRSDLDISLIEGEVVVQDVGGSLKIRHVSGSVRASGNREGIELINVEGEANLYGIPAGKSTLQGVANLSFHEAEQ